MIQESVILVGYMLQKLDVKNKKPSINNNNNSKNSLLNWNSCVSLGKKKARTDVRNISLLRYSIPDFTNYSISNKKWYYTNQLDER